MPTHNNRKSRKTCRKDKKNSRKASRKPYRKSRKSYRKNKKQAGGNPMAQSLEQGQQYAKIHGAQHGGAYLTGAPLSQIDGSMLESGLREFARVGGLDASVAAAASQRDPDQMIQKGGRRTGRKNKASKKSKKNRKASKKSKNNRNSKKSKKNRKSRSRQAGGALVGAPFNGPTMLLTPTEAARAGTADFRNPLLKF